MKLSIVYFNDVHGYLQEHPEIFFQGPAEVIKTAGGYSRILSFIKSIRNENPNTLVFDGGDTFHGTYPVVQTKGEIIVPILNEIGIAAMVGHWDFAYGSEQLEHLAAGLNYPVLGINVYKKDGQLLLPPFLMKQAGGVTIGVIGICSNIINNTIPSRFSEELIITDGKEELPQYIKEVREKGADIVMLLSHNGFPQDCALISKIEGIDVCLSAHTHNRLHQPAVINNTPIIQCGCHGSFVGHLELNIAGKKVLEYSYRLVPMDETVEKDEALDKQIAKAIEAFNHLKDEDLGVTSQNLHRYNTLNGKMDNLLLASIAHAADTKIAFSNGWRYGSPVPAGTITLNDLYNIIPINPPVSTTELSGKEIKGMLEENIERTFACDAFHQMGGYLKRCFGVTAYIKLENPKGQRIQQLFIDKQPVDKERSYTVAFVTKQGVPENVGTNRKDLDIKAVDAMQRFLVENLLTDEIINTTAFVTV
ncbi:5'-nucleotidase [Cnuella takakiae]|uniref:5'-nucleotidase n=1 Tax=Cnuella takakiae TaxID=1302690 RepID=A0A1M4SH26_9BACT|nr:5'-nucleotidase C-terminal domain-containing protein [Cnuella takakiae]OLY94505.1 bifunctional metallophosphatase/5'-nucleotidase [Cnuella takakiae]SHE31505.1 5'-nucleotidase [Cnuella takakiae]